MQRETLLRMHPVPLLAAGANTALTTRLMTRRFRTRRLLRRPTTSAQASASRRERSPRPGPAFIPRQASAADAAASLWRC